MLAFLRVKARDRKEVVRAKSAWIRMVSKVVCYQDMCVLRRGKTQVKICRGFCLPIGLWVAGDRSDGVISWRLDSLDTLHLHILIGCGISGAKGCPEKDGGVD